MVLRATPRPTSSAAPRRSPSRARRTPSYDFAVNIAKDASHVQLSRRRQLAANVSGAPELFWPVGILFLLGIVLGIYSRLRSRRKKLSPRRTKQLFPLFGTAAHLHMVHLAHPSRGRFGRRHPARAALHPHAPARAHPCRARRRLALSSSSKNIGARTLAKSLMRYFPRRSSRCWGYVDYFIVWAQNPNVPGAFNADYVTIGQEINALPTSTPKYVVVKPAASWRAASPCPPKQRSSSPTHSFPRNKKQKISITYCPTRPARSRPARRCSIFSKRQKKSPEHDRTLCPGHRVGSPARRSVDKTVACRDPSRILTKNAHAPAKPAVQPRVIASAPSRAICQVNTAEKWTCAYAI